MKKFVLPLQTLMKMAAMLMVLLLSAAEVRAQTPTQAVPNDVCGGAIVIPPAGPFPHLTTAVDVTNATTTGDPPLPTCQTSVSRSIWYRFTPAVTGSYTISSCQTDAPGATLPDIVLAIYTGASCAGPFTQLPGVAGCDDDSCTTLTLQSIISNTTLTAGTQYFILAHKFGAGAPTAGAASIQFRVALAGAPTPTPSGTPTPSPSPVGCSLINGGLLPRATSESGVPAPSPGFFWSEVQHNTGNNTQANTNAGFNDTQGGGFRLADDFTISQTCAINNVVFYGYLTGAPATPSPFTAYTLQIWNGRPGDPGSVVVFGDTTTNRLASSSDSTFFRIFNTVVPPPGTPQGTTRKIWRNTVNVGGITLPPGTYWVDWASTVTAGANHFAPSKTIAGARGAAGDNARQFATGAWVDVTDVGTPAGGTPVPNDFPFEVNGTPSTVTPTPSATVTPSVTPTVTPNATPTPTPTPTPPPPVITSPLDVTGTVGLPFTYQFEATGATSFAVSNLPPGLGLVFNSALRAIVGNPITSGAFPVVLSATNSGGTTNQTLNITVQSLPPSGPIIVSATAATGRTGRAFSFQLQAIRGSSVTRFTVDSLPPGLNLDSFTGFISGTPTSDGSFRLLVSAIDGTAIAQATLQLTFTSNPAVPIITSPATVILAPGQFFTYSITADANGTFGYIGRDGIVHQEASCAGLPAGLCFDGDHTISGTFSPPFGSDQESATLPDQTGGIITSLQLTAANPPNGGSLLPLFPLRDATGAQNIATRLAVGTGENVLIGGFIIQGNAPKKVVIRTRGPSLTQFGVPNALADPVLDLNEGNVLLSSSDNWRDNQGQATQILGTGLQPTDDREAAILAYLNPGAYTAVERGKNNSTGNALVEVYDLGTVLRADTDNSRLANIATRGTVLGGDSVMIGGVIIVSPNTRVVVRAIGPSLTPFGISGALQDPTLELKNANGVTLISNNDWQQGQPVEIQNAGLAPTDPRESALISTLAVGNYTAIVSGNNNTTGVALVEVYALQ